jgi:hypothetical protein
MRTTLDMDDDVLAAAIELACGQEDVGRQGDFRPCQASLGGSGRSSAVGHSAVGHARVGQPGDGHGEPKYHIRLMFRTGPAVTPETVGKRPEDDTWWNAPGRD